MSATVSCTLFLVVNDHSGRERRGTQCFTCSAFFTAARQACRRPESCGPFPNRKGAFRPKTIPSTPIKNVRTTSHNLPRRIHQPRGPLLLPTRRYLVDRVAARQQGPDEIRRSGQGTATVSPSDSPQPSARMTATADEHDSRMSDSDIRPSPPLPPPLTPITEGGPASGGYRGTAVQSDMMQRYPKPRQRC